MNPRHPWTGATTSAILHVVVLSALVSAAHAAAPTAVPRVTPPVTFMRVVPAPDPAVAVPIARFHAPEPPKLAADPIPLPVPTPVVTKPIDIARAPEPVRAVEPVRPTAKAPEPIGHAIEPPKPVQMAGFDAPAAHAAPVETKRVTAIGAFDTTPANVRPQPGSDRPNVVAEAGFGTAMASPTSQVSPRQVADAGFGATRVDAPTRSAGSVKTTDFDTREAPRAAAPAPRPVRIDDPVEVLTKPTPAYTDEARALKIEGEVVLEVEFTAAGEVRVLRVVRGLGHGLDESATRAALGMRFKPAQSGGRPVDFRTTIHIVFRLA